MKIDNTYIEGLLVITPKVFEDERGYFFETYNQSLFNHKTGLNVNFVQDNESKSSYGTLRGLHYQRGKFAQAKLVRVLSGTVLDIAVDIRINSETYGKYFAIELSSSNKKQLFIPRGFAHGFVVLSDEAVFAYKCDNYYNKESEGGIIYNDPVINIDWIIPADDFILSQKDKENPLLDKHLSFN